MRNVTLYVNSQYWWSSTYDFCLNAPQYKEVRPWTRHGSGNKMRGEGDTSKIKALLEQTTGIKLASIMPPYRNIHLHEMQRNSQCCSSWYDDTRIERQIYNWNQKGINNTTRAQTRNKCHYSWDLCVDESQDQSIISNFQCNKTRTNKRDFHFTRSYDIWRCSHSNITNV